MSVSGSTFISADHWGRRFFQGRRIQRFMNTISPYIAKQFKIHIMAHSNGDDIVTQGLGLLGWPPIESLHIFSGAGQADFEATGFNGALRRGNIQRIFTYAGGQDKALPIAKIFIGRWIGYGTLGLTGPQNVDQVFLDTKRVVPIVKPTFGHSSWFNVANFDDTMLAVTAV